ncbi:poly-beta-1,6-N-acetyl-D-glucosamine biosynthesis protein PgaD [Pseudomonas sp. BCA14]|uniref:poly-beta-1,6-N-acetyl-D-glucosamine biosynthesis protein PgaD n=1 Tax=unclassified Pseudomonas TaxID=196821 RepID=UPI00106EB997|nr:MULTISPECIES: poly-beta-1,6-N-acetyl-D-glucosamine biosynthesis protein PgaD [unclassified Pseudomonas]TFF04737.1 poly-beta-1,6-N-acetyl-D-glucosamine biosynthesis protein PgaD [Pseudomonas sp. JMN1]TFF06215.1 poly-beta-1,6-N-acetyl-D-glucosamine biosynthesis protein PgaD [Pseudomonas sp. BCA17]TFF22204.1 poly-beta-1,6-N-acetyl-D-glucosamine biosynthesis protein PgaD [Pseudomonas sp. BCA14]TFF26601.1 poly-beta-1,6-N-acetyl-D-glucosamine biosynthesis protein PgaD [Pseudomonas sp. BCA13]
MKLVRTRQNAVMWIIDVLLTLLAWFGLIWLLARGMSAMLETHGGPRLEAPIFAALNTLQTYLWIAVFNAVILIGWARYQQRKGRKFAQRRAEANALSDKRLSESFNLGEGDLEQLRRPGVLVIHNDEEGGVGEVKSHVSRDVERPPLTLVPGQPKGNDAGSL